MRPVFSFDCTQSGRDGEPSGRHPAIRVFACLAAAASILLTGALSPATGGDTAESAAPPAAWSNIVEVLAAHAGDDLEIDDALSAFAGRRARLAVEFVRAETAKDGTRLLLFRHAETNIIFHCWAKPVERIPAGRDGVIGGVIRSIRFVERGFQDSTYSIRLDADYFAPAKPPPEARQPQTIEPEQPSAQPPGENPQPPEPGEAEKTEAESTAPAGGAAPPEE